MHLLILAHALDAGAHSVAGLMAPALGPGLTVLGPEWLGQARWSQRIDARGSARTLLHWHGGADLDGSRFGVVWNRIRLLPQAAFRASAARDRDYAGAELQAMVASWLAELGARVEPPMRRHAAVTPVLHPLHWAGAASRCGLALAGGGPVPAEAFSVLRTPLELWASVSAAWPAPFERACHAMAGELGFALLSLGFCGTPAAPLLCRVDAHPVLSSPREAQAVARWLLQRVAASGPTAPDSAAPGPMAPDAGKAPA
jgi:hypothetical protein